MGKTTKKKRNSNNARTTVIVVLGALLILAAFITAVLLLSAERDNSRQAEAALERTSAETFGFDIPGFTLIEDAQIGNVNEQLRVLGVGRYTGLYLEDLSGDEVGDVLAIVVQNISQTWVVNADLTIDCDGRTAEFSVSALPGTAYALLLEKNRMSFDSNMTLRNPACSFCANDMSEYVLDFGQEFAVQPFDGDILVVQNISGREISSDAMLFYKNVASYGKQGEILYLGGILYSTRFSGPIAAGEQRQVAPGHYTITGSAILFMKYDS